MIEFDVGEVECDARTFRTGGLANANEEKGPKGDGCRYGCLFTRVRCVRQDGKYLFVDDGMLAKEDYFARRRDKK